MQIDHLSNVFPNKEEGTCSSPAARGSRLQLVPDAYMQCTARCSRRLFLLLTSHSCTCWLGLFVHVARQSDEESRKT